MKTLTLGIILALHSTGLWAYVPDSWQANLTKQATDPSRIVTSTPASVDTLYRTGAGVTALPVQTGTQSLKIPATSVLAVDVSSGTVLYQQQPLVKRPIASISKAVTALVIMSRHSLTETITIPKLPSYRPEDERIGLVAGEQYSVQDLLRALLIQSANDAADALAIADAGSVPKFTDRMNTKMIEWGIEGTHFVSPSGLMDTNNYARADALAKIGRLTLTNAFLRQTVSQASTTITNTAGRQIYLETTNKLLYTGNFYGIKTGYTLAAGQCFVGLTRVNDHEIITVVLGADDRFGNTQTLRNWIERNWTWL
jgi:serine-type D-Ala-D-Ala carboxypeptidase (penicillin-binding protein 5/6)